MSWVRFFSSFYRCLLSLPPPLLVEPQLTLGRKCAGTRGTVGQTLLVPPSPRPLSPKGEMSAGLQERDYPFFRGTEEGDFGAESLVVSSIAPCRPCWVDNTHFGSEEATVPAVQRDEKRGEKSFKLGRTWKRSSVRGFFSFLLPLPIPSHPLPRALRERLLAGISPEPQPVRSAKPVPGSS